MDKKLKQKIEDLSFLRWYIDNTTDIREFINYETKEVNQIRATDMIFFLEEFLNIYRNNRNHKIVGVDIMSGFELRFSSKEHLLKTAQDIWNNPKKYADLNDDNAYYEFLKYLWIESDYFSEETRLIDIVETN